MRYLIPILLLLLLLSPTAAQEESPLPVLNAEDVFAEGVTVLERLPEIRLDNEARELYYLAPDSSEWEIYPYATEMQKPEYFARRPNARGHIIADTWYEFSDFPSTENWLFQAHTGFSRIETQCTWQVNSNNYDFWFLEPNDEGQYRLCNTATGERTPVIDLANLANSENCPEWMAWDSTNQSPNGEWIIFATCQQDWNIYAYHSPSQTVRFFGSVYYGIDAHLQISKWHSDTELVIANPAHGSSIMASISYYFIDLNQANSIIYAGDLEYNEKTKHYIGITSLGDDIRSTYGIQSFDPVSRQVELLMSFECQLELCYQSDVAISSDLRYVAVAEDVPFAMDAGILFVYDRVQEERVYERQLTGLENLPDMFWTFDNHLVIGNWSEAQKETRDYITLSLFEYLDQSFDLVIDNIDGLDFIVSPDNRFALYHDSEGTWMVYEFDTEQSYPIFVTGQCSGAWLEWKADYIEVNCGHTWRIRIDAVIEEQS